jgi:hypothetical protein
MYVVQGGQTAVLGAKGEGRPGKKPHHANGFPLALGLGACGAVKSYGMAASEGGPPYRLLLPKGDPAAGLGATGDAATYTGVLA